MDKALLNKYIFGMKGSSKEAIRRVYQKLKKNEAKLNQLSEKVKNQKKSKKIKIQIERSKEEEKLIKSISPDEITKIALIISDYDNLINCSELNLEERLKLRIASLDIVQKGITKFKQDWPGSEQWIDITIDLLDVKKIMKSYKNKELIKQLDKQLKQRRNILKVYRAKNKIEETNQDNGFRNKGELEIKKIMKRIKLSDLNKSNLNGNANTDQIDNLVGLIEEEVKSNSKEIKETKENNDIMDIIKSKLDKKIKNNIFNGSSESSDNETNSNTSNDSDQTSIDEDKFNQIKSKNNLKDNQNQNNSNQDGNFADEEEESCSINSYEFDNYADKEIQEQYLQNKAKPGNEDDILIEDYELDEDETDENSVKDQGSEESTDELEKNEDNKSSNEINSNSDQDIEKASEEYLKKQLIKIFGEEIALKSSKDDVYSDEEWVDDFFINKKVKKFKPTFVDLQRYKDLEEKEKAVLNKNGNESEKQQSEDDKKSKKLKKRSFFKKRKINLA